MLENCLTLLCTQDSSFLTFQSHRTSLTSSSSPNWPQFFNRRDKSLFLYHIFDHTFLCMYACRFQYVVLCCPTPRLHCFLSSHWPSFRFLSFMAFLIPSNQFFFGLPHALFCFCIHFIAILGNLPSAILWTWPYHVSWFCSISFIIGSSNF